MDKYGNENTEIKPVTIDMYAWMDQDVFNPHFAFGDTLRDSADQLNWANGQPIDEPFISEGIINPKTGDTFDYKLIAMKPLDTITISLECPENGNYSINFYGPFALNSIESNFDSVSNSALRTNELFISIDECLDGIKNITLPEIIIDYDHHTQNINTEHELFYVAAIAAITNQEHGFYKLTLDLEVRQ